FANGNTYSGRTNVNGGILSVSGSNNLGDASPTNDLAFDGGTLQASGPIASATRNVTVNGGGGTIDTNSNAVAFGNVDGGTGGLTKTGAGNLTVNYARLGSLNVTGGQLVMAPNGQVAGVSVVNATSIAGGARL